MSTIPDDTAAGPRDMLGRQAVLSLAEARQRLADGLAAIPPVSEETVPLNHALHRVVARPVRAPEDLPPACRSVMDGYAVRAADTYGATEGMPGYLEITGEILMGAPPTIGPNPGECFRIATGGLLPPGTDAVLMLEHTVPVDSTMIEVLRPVAVGDNVITAGEDVRRGREILTAGQWLRPRAIGLLAALGITELAVRRRVTVGILATGDEIVPYDQKPPPGKIRDTNSPHLEALVREVGCLPRYYGIAPDNEKNLREKMGQALEENDCVLFSGSSSVGTRDLGERVLATLGKPGILVHGIAIKPGKPVIVAIARNTPVFGLPGHPVSAAMAFDLLVRPALDHLAGRQVSPLPQRPAVQARLTRNLPSAAGRRDFIRVRLLPSPDDGGFLAEPIPGKSGALSTMVQADGLLVIPEESQGITRDSMVTVEIF